MIIRSSTKPRAPLGTMSTDDDDADDACGRRWRWRKVDTKHIPNIPVSVGAMQLAAQTERAAPASPIHPSLSSPASCKPFLRCFLMRQTLSLWKVRKNGSGKHTHTHTVYRMSHADKGGRECARARHTVLKRGHVLLQQVYGGRFGELHECQVEGAVGMVVSSQKTTQNTETRIGLFDSSTNARPGQAGVVVELKLLQSAPFTSYALQLVVNIGRLCRENGARKMEN